MRVLATVVAVLAVLIGSAGAAEAQARVKAEINVCAATCDVSSTTFALTETRDLTFFVSYRGLRGTHIETLRYVLPNGDVYQVVERTVDTKTGIGLQATKLRGMSTSASAFAVAGTFIEMRMITGVWRVQVLIDGAMVAESEFELY